jgi:hypothetical protein
MTDRPSTQVSLRKQPKQARSTELVAIIPEASSGFGEGRGATIHYAAGGPDSSSINNGAKHKGEFVKTITAIASASETILRDWLYLRELALFRRSRKRSHRIFAISGGASNTICSLTAKSRPTEPSFYETPFASRPSPLAEA